MPLCVHISPTVSKSSFLTDTLKLESNQGPQFTIDYVTLNLETEPSHFFFFLNNIKEIESVVA